MSPTGRGSAASLRVDPDCTLALVGLPGSGKTTVGRRLAKTLALRFADADQAIEDRIGCSIALYFENRGEESFRDVEEELVRELTTDRGQVLSTGGGVVLRQANRQRLRDRCHVVYFHATPQVVFRRLRTDKVRPLLQVADPLARLHTMYETRDPLYRETAHSIVETVAASSTSDLAAKVIQVLLEASVLTPAPQ